MRDIKKIVSEMTLEEKVGMCSGCDFWHLKGVERLNIPSVMMSDGPHGLRKQRDEADHLGINDSIKAVCFPTGCTSACSFDRDLIYRLGEALGLECQAENVSVILGPSVNIKRSPLGGRNFEYFSEDPYLSSQMAIHHIKGVQSQGVGASIKHFVANNQEERRMTVNSILDERTLREIYLPSFELAVKEAKPWTVMTSYNRLNGTYTSEDSRLLTDILRKEWGFDGYVVSDWGAVNNRVAGLQAGMDLEMPGSNGTNDRLILDGILEGKLDESLLDTTVARILEKIFEFVDNRQEVVVDLEAHHQLARQIANESAVLLKNDAILPLSSMLKISFIGELAVNPRYQGGGSSHVNSFKVSSALEAGLKIAPITYAQGYEIKTEQTNEFLLQEAIEVAQQSEVTVIFAGLADEFESEGYDRMHMRLPNCQNELISKIVEVQPNTVIVLYNGSPVEMPWVHNVKGILEMYLAGQAVGESTVDLLFGVANPCGKLAETFPIRLQDTPAYFNHKVINDEVYYGEGIFVGYRYYDTKEIPVLFPFGHGLSYTQFKYSNLELSHQELLDTDELIVSLDITNTGTVEGKEIVQLYVSDHTHTTIRPKKELKNFVKIELQPGETKYISMTLTKRSFSWYNPKISDWDLATGEYEIQIGKSSTEILLNKTILVKSTVQHPLEVTLNTTIGELLENKKLKPFIDSLLNSIDQTQSEAITEQMQQAMIKDMPLRALRSFQGVDNDLINSLVITLNHLLK